MSKTSQEPKFTLGKLRENCKKIFGVTQSTFDGATYGIEGEEFTVAEIKKTIEEWKRKEVK